MHDELNELNDLDSLDQLAVLRANADQMRAVVPEIMGVVHTIYKSALNAGFTRGQAFNLASSYYRVLIGARG